MSNHSIRHFTKTRFAPTPSGYLHLGNILSFGITAALAKKHNAKIMLRIDDLDKTRANPLYVQDIFDTLNFLGVTWDEGPRNADEFKNAWSQLQRLNIYNEAIDQLKINGYLFVCTCSRVEYSDENCTCIQKQLPFETPSANWRIKTDKCRIGIKSINGNIVEAELPVSMHNFIVRKKDGYPSYQLASVIDDLHFGTDLIVRGQDLWDSTLAQHFLAKQLGENKFGDIAFYHHPLITDAYGEKLSKSAGATSIKYLREYGKSPTDVFAAIFSITGIKAKAETWGDFINILTDKFLL